MVSKSAEKAVVGQLFWHCSDNAPLPVHQSSYRQFHSTETALFKVQSDILSNMDKQEVTLLVLLDLSAAFNTRDFKIQERGRHQRRRSRVGPVSRTPCLWREK